jgi:hypothetical protein
VRGTDVPSTVDGIFKQAPNSEVFLIPELDDNADGVDAVADVSLITDDVDDTVFVDSSLLSPLFLVSDDTTTDISATFVSKIGKGKVVVVVVVVAKDCFCRCLMLLPFLRGAAAVVNTAGCTGTTDTTPTVAGDDCRFFVCFLGAFFFTIGGGVGGTAAVVLTTTREFAVFFSFFFLFLYRGGMRFCSEFESRKLLSSSTSSSSENTQSISVKK